MERVVFGIEVHVVGFFAQQISELRVGDDEEFRRVVLLIVRKEKGVARNRFVFAVKFQDDVVFRFGQKHVADHDSPDFCFRIDRFDVKTAAEIQIFGHPAFVKADDFEIFDARISGVSENYRKTRLVRRDHRGKADDGVKNAVYCRIDDRRCLQLEQIIFQNIGILRIAVYRNHRFDCGTGRKHLKRKKYEKQSRKSLEHSPSNKKTDYSNTKNIIVN